MCTILQYGHGDELNCDQTQEEVRRSFRRNVKLR